MIIIYNLYQLKNRDKKSNSISINIYSSLALILVYNIEFFISLVVMLNSF